MSVKDIQRWAKLVVEAGLEPDKLEEELLEQKTLNGTKQERVAELVELGSRSGIAKKKVETLKAELESLRSLAKGVVSKAKEELEDISDEAKSGVKTSADDLKSKVDEATRSVDGFKKQVEDTYRTTFETGETIGKYETLKPLVKFMSTGQGTAGEVIPLAARFTGKLVPWASDKHEYGIWDRAKALNEKLNETLEEG